MIVGVARGPGGPGSLWVASFVDQREATVRRMQRGADGSWTSHEDLALGLASGIASADLDGDGALDLVVARAYGDGPPGSDGDVFVLGRDGRRTLLPSTRGARAIAAAPAAAAHPAVVVFADGWHQNYGQLADALITTAMRAGGSWEGETLTWVAGRWGYERLALGDVDGDGSLEAVAAGLGPAILVSATGGEGQAPRAIGSGDSTDVALGDLDGDGMDEVVVAGIAAIWHAR